jgi:hypothetical protein
MKPVRGAGICGFGPCEDCSGSSALSPHPASNSAAIASTPIKVPRITALAHFIHMKREPAQMMRVP